MNKIRKLFYYIFVRPQVVLIYTWKKLSPIIPAKLYIKVLFRLIFGYWMDFKNPRSFNEKLQWLKLYDKRPEYVKLVDKYEAKRIVAEVLGEKSIIPTLGVWDRVEDITFDQLPNQFVLKCTHDSGGLVICKDKTSLDIDKAKKKIAKCLKNNYYNEGKEWPYKKVPHRIIAEQYIEATKDNDLFDYKLFCFGGKVRFYKIDYGRYIEHHANYYSLDGELLPFGEQSCMPTDRFFQKPKNFELMINYAELLSKGHPFMRVDFYNVDGEIKWGECTLYPASGFGIFIPDSWDMKLGEMLSLPNES